MEGRCDPASVRGLQDRTNWFSGEEFQAQPHTTEITLFWGGSPEYLLFWESKVTASLGQWLLLDGSSFERGEMGLVIDIHLQLGLRQDIKASSCFQPPCGLKKMLYS